MNKFFYKHKNRFFILILLFILHIFIKSQHTLYAEDKSNVIPKVSMGAGFTYGYYDVIQESGEHAEWEGGAGIGGGFIIEKKYSNRFGIHSGVWFNQIKLELFMADDSHDSDTEDVGTTENDENELMVKNSIKSNILTFPFYLTTSFNMSIITISFLAGLNLSYITESIMSNYSSGVKQSENIQKYIGYMQLGAGGGIAIKLHITRFIDIFVAGIGERYFSNIVSEADDMTDFIYDYRIHSGILLRTF